MGAVDREREVAADSQWILGELLAEDKLRDTRYEVPLHDEFCTGSVTE